MSELAIRVEHLGKKYRLGGQQARYSTFREALVNAARAPLGWLKGGRQAEQNILWALDDVSFEVRHGEAVGIIGRNGAGKSTLLKILSRITSPTRGRVDIYGRVGSLLEVGTGFHPELTGRENIFLNGAILGMTRREIDRKFDEIVDFAEIEKFLDTPIKFYSSGMYVRLAFAVAAHLEPEILVVDEVLAVGDAEFQKKCLGKMGDVAHEGKTVLFVSHNMAAIVNFCKRGILLKAGKLDFDGRVNDTVTWYTNELHKTKVSLENCARRGGSGGVHFDNILVTDLDNNQTNVITSDEPIVIHLEATFSHEFQNKSDFVVGCGIDTSEGMRIITCVSSWIGKYVSPQGSLLRFFFKLPKVPLIPGKYMLSISISYSGDTLDYVEHCCEFEIIPIEKKSEFTRDRTHGLVIAPFEFGTDHV